MVDWHIFLLYNCKEVIKLDKELIRFGKDVPMRMTFREIGTVSRSKYRALELLLVLKGRAEVVIDDRAFSIAEDDILAVNENSMYRANSEGNCALVSLEIYSESLPRFEGGMPYFDCNSALDNDKGRYYRLKHLIAELVKHNSNDNASNDCYSFSVMWSILYELTAHFVVKRTGTAATNRYLERLNRIVDYIDKHYQENLTLNRLADHEHLSVPYLSSFIEKYLGVNFMTYYNELRLERAVNDLLRSEDTVEAVAFRNGFADPRSFVNLFKKKYDTLPSLYRKQQLDKSDQNTFTSERIEFDESALLILAKYLPQNETDNLSSDSADEKIVVKEKIDVLKASTELRHTFKTFTSVARAKELLFSDVQQMLTELQRDVGYEYIKFHGLLSDDMLVYEEDEQGNPHYSFVYIDKVLDFLLSIGLKPLIQFSFMPKALASDVNHVAFASPFNISPPKSMQKWCDLISALMSHLIDRYTTKTVRSWLFCVWNEPDTTESLFGFSNDKDFYDFYKATFETVKAFGKRYNFGSPSLLVSYSFNNEWTTRFIGWCRENKCLPDFMNIHYYDNDFSDDSISQHRPGHPAHGRLNRDENSFRKCLEQMKIDFDNLGIGELPVYLTEWNLTVSHRNLLNDTCFKSCYLTKNLLENYDKLDSFGYWTLTDFIEELQPSKEEFHGGLGLFTANGIKKPHYHIFRLMNRLGDRLIGSGEGYFITKSYGTICIILYNYEHFNHLFASAETFDMTFTQRYTPFSQLGKMDMSLELINIPSKHCTIRETIVNQMSGSAFDEWVRMGAPPLGAEDIDYLKKISVPRCHVHSEVIEDGTLNVSAALDPLEVRLIEIGLS